MTQRFVLPLVALVVLAAGCSGAGSAAEGVASLSEVSIADDATTTTAATSMDQERAMLDFAACMRDNGVDIEDPTVDADGNLQFGGFRGIGDGTVDRTTLQAAREACQDELDGVVLGFRGEAPDLTEMQDMFVEYAACMRENGYDMPDPDFSSFGPRGDGEPGQGGGPFASMDPSDPDFVAAQAVCQDILGDFGRGLDGGRAAPPAGTGSDG
jgi:hypothetical protein